MNLKKLLAAIDAEIAKFEQAKALLLADESPKPRRGRKPKNAKPVAVATPKKKRNLSPEARARIAEAQKKRWAAKAAKK